MALTTIEKNKLGSGEYGEGECKFSFNVHTKIFCEGVNVLFKVQTFDDSDSKTAVSKNQLFKSSPENRQAYSLHLCWTSVSAVFLIDA